MRSWLVYRCRFCRTAVYVAQIDLVRHLVYCPERHAQERRARARAEQVPKQTEGQNSPT